MDDFDREIIMEELYEKMLEELNSFRDSLLRKSTSEALSGFNPYELVYKEDFLLCFEDDELDLDEELLLFLNHINNPLDWIYQSWCDSGVSHMDILRDFVRNLNNAKEGV